MDMTRWLHDMLTSVFIVSMLHLSRWHQWTYLLTEVQYIA